MDFLYTIPGAFPFHNTLFWWLPHAIPYLPHTPDGRVAWMPSCFRSCSPFILSSSLITGFQTSSLFHFTLSDKFWYQVEMSDGYSTIMSRLRYFSFLLFYYRYVTKLPTTFCSRKYAQRSNRSHSNQLQRAFRFKFSIMLHMLQNSPYCLRIKQQMIFKKDIERQQELSTCLPRVRKSVSRSAVHVLVLRRNGNFF